jgi:hypothetical protein
LFRYQKNDAAKRQLVKVRKQTKGKMLGNSPLKRDILENRASQTVRPSTSITPIRPTLRPFFEDKPPPMPTILQDTDKPTSRPTFSLNSCKAMTSDESRGSNYSLSFEIVAPSKNVSYVKFGDTFTDCAPPITEFLVRYKANLQNIVQVIDIREDEVNDICMTNLDCTSQPGSVCIAGHCVKAGKPLFALIWKGNENYKLRIRPPNGRVFVAGKGTLSSWNVKMIMFPWSGGPIGKYMIDVRSTTPPNTMLNAWDLVTFPGKNKDGLTLIQNGTGSRANMYFIYPNSRLT